MGAGDTDRIRLGVIGTGSHASENLLPALHLHPDFELAALSSRSIQRARAFSQSYGIPWATGNWRELVSLENLDAVLVAATPTFHSEVAQFALESGLHLFVEKPPAPNIATLRTLADLEQKRGDIVVFVGFNFRFAEAISSVQTAMASEGQLKHALIRFVSSKPRQALWEQPSVERSLLYAVGIHAVEMAHAWFGRPSVIKSSVASIGPELISLGAILQFNGGRMVSLELGNYSNRFESRYELIWESGGVAVVEDQTRISIHGASSGSPALGPKSTVNLTLPSSRGGFRRAGYEQVLSEFARTIHERKASPCSLRSCLDVYETMHYILDDMGFPKE